MLEVYGVKHVFGLPGDTSLALYDSFRRSAHLQHVLTRDERSSAYMADAYAKVTGRPGVCEGPSGGGALYIIPGVAEADGSRVPLVCLTTDVPLASDGRGSLTSLDQMSLFEPVTRFATRVLSPAKLPETIRRAFRSATAERQGAAQITLPENALSQETDTGAPGDFERLERDLFAEARHSAFPAYRRLPPDSDLERVAELFWAAARPAILAGGGVHLSAAWDQLRELAELACIPVATTLNGKGAISEAHPLALGVVGGNGGKDASNSAVAEADLVLVVGSRLNSTSTAGGQVFGPKARLVQVDLDPSQIGNCLDVEVGLAGDARVTLAALASVLQGRKEGAAQVRLDWIQAKRRAISEELTRYEDRFCAEQAPLPPHRVVRALEKSLPADSLLVCDAGTPTPFVGAFYRSFAAGRTFIAGRAHGSLGYALPAAIGAKIGAPGRPVVGLFGDGSFAMACGELETLGRSRLPIVLVCFRNHTYSWIKCLQQVYFAEAYFGVDFGTDADYCAVARAYGLDAVRPASGVELDRALTQAVRSDRPTFVEVTVQCMTAATPPVRAWQRDLALAPKDRRHRSY